MKKAVITFFGSGLSPVAPGTVGSLAISAVLAIVMSLTAPTPTTWALILLIALLAACAFSVAFGKWAVGYFGREDPQPFVLDEVAGICLTNLLLPMRATLAGRLGVIGLAFLAFRLFDVTKPPPARQLENLPAGWGILCDDLAAAVYANLLCQFLLRMHF